MSRQVDDDNQVSDSDSQYAEGFDDDEEMLKNQVIPAFLSKTYAIMHNEEYKDIVCWGENGESILILKVDDFSKKVLPHYFKHGNFSSFVRQLNMYGFHKTRQDPNWREFKHPLFKKGHIELLPLIKRKNGSSKVKPEKRERSSDLNEHALSMNVKKSKMDRDMILRDLTLLKKQTAEMEAKYTNVLQENRLLWQTIMKSKKQQDTMKLQMERICRFLYKVYPNRIQGVDDVNYNMLQDKVRSYDGDGFDPTSLPDDGLLTPDQYNSSLDFLQMNNVPRVDSPRNGPMLSTLDFNRPMNRLITNGGSNSSLRTKQSILFPAVSPSISPSFNPSSDSGPIDLDDYRSIDMPFGQPPTIPSAPQQRNDQVAPSSPIPPLSLGEPFLKENESQSLPGTSQIPQVPEEGNSNDLNNDEGLGSEVMRIPGNEDSFTKISYPFVDNSPITIDTNNIVDSLHLGVKKMDEKSNMLQQRVSQMETELSSPFMAPNIEMMEKNGMF